MYVRLSLGAETLEVARFMGPKGILEASEHELRYSPQRGVDTGPSYYANSFSAKIREEYVRSRWHAEHDLEPGH